MEMNERIIDLLHEMMEARTEFLCNDSLRSLNFPSRNTLVARFLNNESLVIELVNRIHSAQVYGDFTQALLTVTLPGGGGIARNFSDPVTVTASTNQINAGLEPIQAASSPCAICQEAISSGGVRIRACQHEYHRACIVNWFSMSVRCPVCRHDIRETGPEAQTSTDALRTAAPLPTQSGEPRTSE
jgi:hypothetical protein